MRVRTSTSDPLDFCRRCALTEEEAFAKYGNVGNGPDGRGNCFVFDDDHPDYVEMGYVCRKCDEMLTEED